MRRERREEMGEKRGNGREERREKQNGLCRGCKGVFPNEVLAP